MGNPEIEPAACASCPNRSRIGRFLAEQSLKSGLTAASEDCVGPDTYQFYDLARDPQPNALYIWPTLTQEDTVCPRDELLLEQEQKQLGQSDSEPNKRYIGTGPDEELLLMMQKAVTKLGETVLLTGAMYDVSKRHTSKYYKEKLGFLGYTNYSKTPKFADQKRPNSKRFIII